MNIETNTKNGIDVLKVSGRMDASTVTLFNEECQKLLEKSTGSILIDLEGLEYISSAGLRGILTMAKECKAGGHDLAFCSMRDMVAEMFKISGFISILKLYPSEEEAVAAMN